MADRIDGHCLCGAVRISTVKRSDEMSACFCDMCTRWSGTAGMGFDGDPEATVVTGPVKTYRSSSFSERAWCDACGSALWLRDDDGDYELVPGLFENAAGCLLTRVVYADRAPDGWNFAGTPKRVTKADYEASHQFVPEGDPS